MKPALKPAIAPEATQDLAWLYFAPQPIVTAPLKKISPIEQMYEYYS